MAKKVIPLGDRVVIQAGEQEETKSASGFVVASSTPKNERPQSGKILAVGPDVKHLKEEEEVVFKEFIPALFEMEDEKYLIVSEEDVLAKLG